MNVPDKLEVPLFVKDTDGNEHEVERLVYRLERNNKSRWAELFSTPELAARTLYDALMCVKAANDCSRCELNGLCVRCGDYDALLEWLGGESDGK